MQIQVSGKSIHDVKSSVCSTAGSATLFSYLFQPRRAAEVILCRFRQLTILGGILLLGACTAVSTPALTEAVENEPAPQFLDLFGERPDIPQLDTVLTLTPQQQQAFLEYFNLPKNQTVPPYMRVANYLFENTLNLQYDGITLTAAQTLELNKGNCMSLALLTTALVKLANVDISYQLVDSSPVFGLTDNLVKKEIHIKSVVYQRAASNVSKTALLLSDRVFIDYFPSRRGRFISNLTAEQFIAMYYLNIAGEALEKQDYAGAYWHLREALDYNPYDAAAWNTMAVVYRRAGEPAKAEEIYKFAIAHAEDKLTLLKNYHLLLTSQQRTVEAAAIEKQLDGMDDPSPFHWYTLARSAYAMQDYPAAIRYFDRALKMAPYLHEAHLGKAQSFYQLGYLTEAELALKKAILNVDKSSTRSLYEAKLTALAGK